ncbi:MAG: pseudaminic acid biosynthesis-associated methylase [Candidatus Omnitrophota bacterium]
MKKSYQLKNIWEGEFGKEWSIRNYMERAKLRESFWSELLKYVPKVRSVLEIGCNVGMNLQALHKANQGLKITGLEPNNYAFQEAKKIAKGRWSVLNDDVLNATIDKKVDLVFTCTVLIHIDPNDMESVLRKIYDLSNSYILAMEYYWPWPIIKEIRYRGLKNALWKRDFGALWLKYFKLEVIEVGYIGDLCGFDRTTWWLFKKK